MQLALTLWLAQSPCDRQGAALVAEALARASLFDLAGAAARAEDARSRGCQDAEVPAIYFRGLVAAREAARFGGSPGSLQPVMRAVASLDALTRAEPRAAIAQAVLRAAAAASQSERQEMSLHIEHAASLEALQLAAGQRGAPGVAAHEAGGELWLQVHRYEDARQFFTRAITALGATPRITLGLARTAARLEDSRTACDRYRALLRAVGGRAAEAPEVVEARTYLAHPACAAPEVPPR
jgi:hypothetical protein